MPFWISDAMIKLCRGPQWFSLSHLWFSLSRILRFSLSYAYGLAYRVIDSFAVRLLIFALFGGTMVMLIATSIVLLVLLLAVVLAR
jgi:hypothetical protein